MLVCGYVACGYSALKVEEGGRSASLRVAADEPVWRPLHSGLRGKRIFHER